MANNYGITAQESTPSQETIDGFLNWCDNNPPDVDVEGITQDVADKLREQLDELKSSVEEKMKEIVDPPLEYLQAQMDAIAPIQNAPSANLGDIVGWIQNVIQFLTKPYQPIMDAVAWWPQFQAAATSAVSGTISRCDEMISKLSAAAPHAAEAVV